METAASATSRDAHARYAAPAWTLLAVNGIPLVGVLLWNWSAYHVVALYWFENVILGLINVLKIAACSPDHEALLKQIAKLSAQHNVKDYEAHHGERLIRIAGSNMLKIFLIPFFLFHYGMFCFGHGVFIYALLGIGLDGTTNETSMFDLSDMFAMILSGGSLFAALALAGSHLFSFAHHYIGQGEYRESNPMQLMVTPYARIFILHVAIIAGGFAVMALNQPIVLLALLVVGKTILDWRLHVKAHAH